MRRFEGSSRPGWVAWIPLVSLVAVALIGTVFLSLDDVFDLLDQCDELVSSNDPEEARFAFSPWLKPYFETADEIGPLPRDVSAVVEGRHRYFVAYRLMPRVSFLDDPRVIERLRNSGIGFVRIVSEKSRLAKGDVGTPGDAHVFRGGFEGGRVDEWSSISRKTVEDGR